MRKFQVRCNASPGWEDFRLGCSLEAHSQMPNTERVMTDAVTPVRSGEAPPSSPVTEQQPSQSAGENDPANCCAICLDTLDPLATGNNACATLPCTHAFHVACVLRFARSNDDNHGRCPLCRATDPATYRMDSSGDEVPEPSPYPPPVRESGQALLERAVTLAAAGEGSAILRRHCRTLVKLRDEKHAAIAAAAAFKTTHAQIMKQHSALRQAKKRAMERQQSVKLSIVAHVRTTSRLHTACPSEAITTDTCMLSPAVRCCSFADAIWWPRLAHSAAPHTRQHLAT